MGAIDMCLLIVKPAGVKVPKGLCVRATRAHPDGWGVAWARNGKAEAVKDASVSVEMQLSILDSITDSPAIVHWRYATHGAVCFDNAHPFGLPDGGFAAHNGTIPGYGSRDRSDTAHFVDNILSLYHGAEDIQSDAPYLARMIGGSRIATIHPSGDIVRLGSGWIRGKSGIIASNRSGFRSRYQGRPSRSLWGALHATECDICDDLAVTHREWNGDHYAVCASCARHGDRHYLNR